MGSLSILPLGIVVDVVMQRRNQMSIKLSICGKADEFQSGHVYSLTHGVPEFDGVLRALKCDGDQPAILVVMYG